MPHSSFPGHLWPESYNTPYNYNWDDNQYTNAPIPRPLQEMEEHKYIPSNDIMAFDQHPQITAIGKPSRMFNELYIKKENTKPMEQWNNTEVVEWLCEETSKCPMESHGMETYEGVHLENFHDVNGYMLLNMGQHEFLEKDTRFGHFLFEAVQQHRREEKSFCEDNLPPFNNIRQQDEITYTDISASKSQSRLVNSDNDSYVSDSSSQPDVKPPDIAIKPPGTGRRVGRPPKPTRTKRGNKEKKCGRLWEFIRDLLLKPEYCPSLICWENHDEGVFRFVRSDKVAELWGTIKENPKMTYEKLSRAMRYYYKSQVLLPVLGRRLVYKFGPTARGWRTNNPNFRDSTQ